jgi:hypothetical protein
VDMVDRDVVSMSMMLGKRPEEGGSLADQTRNKSKGETREKAKEIVRNIPKQRSGLRVSCRCSGPRKPRALGL